MQLQNPAEPVTGILGPIWLVPMVGVWYPNTSCGCEVNPHTMGKSTVFLSSVIRQSSKYSVIFKNNFVVNCVKFDNCVKTFENSLII